MPTTCQEKNNCPPPEAFGGARQIFRHPCCCHLSDSRYTLRKEQERISIRDRANLHTSKIKTLNIYALPSQNESNHARKYPPASMKILIMANLSAKCVTDHSSRELRYSRLKTIRFVILAKRLFMSLESRNGCRIFVP
jgi:hypothetical protein